MQKKLQPLILQQKQSQPTVIESVCTVCFENGQTRLLMTKIPFFRDIMVTSFHCDSCGHRNTEVQFIGQLPDYGVQILWKAMDKGDLNREIIISEHARIWIQELQLELPKIKKAEITTLEGLLVGVYQDLQQNQQQRKQKQPQRYTQIQSFLQLLQSYSSGQKFPITLKITDPSGNSNIKNPYAPKADKNLHISSTKRTLQQLTSMGYSIQNAKQQLEALQQKNIGTKINFTKPFQESQFMKYQPVIFEVPCHSCQMPGQMKMCQTSVPYFTDMVIMSFLCDYCGAHSTETKNTGDIKDEGCVITLKANGEADLKRDLFKSQTCSLEIPELELQLDYGTLGGVFTTVEGLLEKISDHLDQNNPFADSDNQFHQRMQKLLKELQELRTGKKQFTLILKDPLGHSFLQNPDHPAEDKRAKRQLYKRTEYENQMMGISDMKVEGYQKSDNVSQKSAGSMKKSKDRKYSQGSVQSLQQLKKNQEMEENSPNKKVESSNSLQPPPNVKFTKQSPVKPKQKQLQIKKQQQGHRKLSHTEGEKLK